MEIRYAWPVEQAIMMAGNPEVELSILLTNASHESLANTVAVLVLKVRDLEAKVNGPGRT